MNDKIYVFTVHWKSVEWIDIQLKFLNKYLNNFEIHAFLNNVSNENYNNNYYKFNKCYRNEIKSHSENLNILSQKVKNVCNFNDVFLFLDGDAFPIQPLNSYIQNKIKNYPLCAVQRKENGGDIQPHPCFCFCFCTAKFWYKNNLNWNRDNFRWKNNSNNWVRDVGGNLYKKLLDLNLDWFKIKKTNNLDIHPVLFSVYDDIVYHHGAGFRKIQTRAKIKNENIFKKHSKVVFDLIKNDKLDFKDVNKSLSQNMKYYFIHVPKTGGCSVIKMFKNFNNFNYQEGHEKAKNKSKDFSFAFVRNPWDRLVSSFFYLKNGGIHIKDKRDGKKYCYHNTFEEFVEHLYKNSHILSKQVHLMPQNYFICRKNEILVDYVAKFENFENEIIYLSNLLNFKIDEINHENKSNHDIFINYYNYNTFKKVRELYNDDIEIFGYKKFKLIKLI